MRRGRRSMYPRTARAGRPRPRRTPPVESWPWPKDADAVVGKAQDDGARLVAVRAPQRAVRPRGPSPGPIGRQLVEADPVPYRPGPHRARIEAAVPPAPSRQATPCTRGRRAGRPPVGARGNRPGAARAEGRRKGEQAGSRSAPRAPGNPRRPVRGRPPRGPLDPPGRARPRQDAPVVVATVGARARSGPASAAGDSQAPPTRFHRGPNSPAAADCASQYLPSPATVCAAR